MMQILTQEQINSIRNLSHLQKMDIYIYKDLSMASLRQFQILKTCIKINIFYFKLCIKATLRNTDDSPPLQILNKFKSINSQTQKFLTKIIDQNGDIIKWAQKLQQWECINLEYRQNKNTVNPLIHLSNTIFNCLKTVHIIQNQIETIEPLCRIRAPNLTTINIGGNKITNLRPLCKINSSQVKMIKFDGNFAKQLHCLTESNFVPLIQVQIQGFIESRQNHQCFTIQPLMKMKLSQNLGLNIQSTSRIEQSMLLKCLKTKKAIKSTIWSAHLIY